MKIQSCGREHAKRVSIKTQWYRFLPLLSESVFFDEEKTHTHTDTQTNTSLYFKTFFTLKTSEQHLFGSSGKS